MSSLILSPASPQRTLDINLEFSAHSIIDSFKNKQINGLDGYKLSQVYKVLKPLYFRNNCLLYAFTSFLLISFNDDDRYLQYLSECENELKNLKMKVDLDYKCFNNELLVQYIISLSCLSLIYSIIGDSYSWKKSFEGLFEVIKRPIVKQLIIDINSSNGTKIIHEDYKTALLWTMHWFFQQDITKLFKVTDCHKIGPVFTKAEYKKLLNSSDEHPVASEEKFTLDPIFSCCSDLYLVLGTINKVYDEFLIKINGPIDHYYQFIKPRLDKMTNDDQKLEFLNSDEYSIYEDVRIQFHDWVQLTSSRLEDQIVNCTINTQIINSLPDFEIELIIKYFTLFQRTILLYLKIKLKELNAPMYEIKQLTLHMFKALRELSGGALNDYLLFPLLIVGASVSEYRDKLMVQAIYTKIEKYTKFKRNLNQIWQIILEFWNINPDGVTFCMWQNAINKLDWNICLL